MNEAAQGKGELTIGGLAKAAGVNVETIRYYQRIGLVEEPIRPVSGFRRYSPQMVQRIKFVKRAQGLGFKLQEIAELLLLGEGHCADVRQRAEEKRKRIQSQIEDLKALRDTLDELIGACRRGKDQHRCPIVETLLR